MVGTGAIEPAEQGVSVALSADGNTVDRGRLGRQRRGRSGVGLHPQRRRLVPAGPKLVGTGAIGAAKQGSSVALSADGNTAMVGGPERQYKAGAAWVFTRSGGVWSQQGPKLVGTGAVGTPQQGAAVALSADGNTAIVGGSERQCEAGAAWVFTRSGGVWTQQGSKLVGTGAVGGAQQGNSVALSADGNTAMVGGIADNLERRRSVGLHARGTGWPSRRSWSGAALRTPPTRLLGRAVRRRQHCVRGRAADDDLLERRGSSPAAAASGVRLGSKLVGTGAVGSFLAHGFSVALSGDGTTALSGGVHDNSNAGAAWVFVAPNFNPPATHDFNGDGMSDILFRDTAGDVGMWLMNGSLIQQMATFSAVPTSWTIVGQRDFNGNGDADMLWRDTAGDVGIWFMNGTTAGSMPILGTVPTNWSIVGTGDLNGDGNGDILWLDASGDVGIWFMNGATIVSMPILGTVPTNWSIVGDDNKGDIFWRDTAGDVAVWQVSGTQIVQSAGLGNVPTNWVIAGLGDFNGDGITDILWRDTVSGTVGIWFLNSSLTVQSTTNSGAVPLTWAIAQTGDYNGDGTSDILWIDSSGNVGEWFMNAGQVSSSPIITNVGTTWSVQGLNAD